MLRIRQILVLKSCFPMQFNVLFYKESAIFIHLIHYLLFSLECLQTIMEPLFAASPHRLFPPQFIWFKADVSKKKPRASKGHLKYDDEVFASICDTN